MQGIDLHTHSHISDGTLSPVDLVHAAHAAGVHTLALTDHDTMQGIASAEPAAKALNMTLVHGVEISSQWQRASTQKTFGLHVVALNTQNPEPIQQLLHDQQQLRAARAALICQKLQQILKIDIWSDVLLQVDGHSDRVTRTHIAKALINQHIVSRPQQAFDRFLKEGKAAYVRFDGVHMANCIATIHAAKGLAVLAHPTRYGLSATHVRQLVGLFAQAGGDAVELPPSNEAPATRQMLDQLIAQYALKVSVGSDFHGDNMPWVKLGQVPKLAPEQVGIWQQFV